LCRGKLLFRGLQNAQMRSDLRPGVRDCTGVFPAARVRCASTGLGRQRRVGPVFSEVSLLHHPGLPLQRRSDTCVIELDRRMLADFPFLICVPLSEWPTMQDLSGQHRLWLSIPAYNLGNLWPRLDSADRHRRPVADQFGAVCGEDGRSAGQTCAVYWLTLAEGHLTRTRFLGDLTQNRVVAASGQTDRLAALSKIPMTGRERREKCRRKWR